MRRTDNNITPGFILCAGFGTRMRPLTDSMPKPMVPVHGKPMIDHVLDSFAAQGINRVVINTHYLGDVLKDHLKARKDVTIALSHEDEILDTGGGIVNALPLLEDGAFYVSSGDSYLQDGEGEPALSRMEAAWDPEKMDILILLQPTAYMILTHGVGDYDLDKDGRAIRSLDQSGAYMFTSLRINAPSIFDAAPRGPFSYLQLLDKAQARGRLYGIVHDGQWHHISTPEDVARVNDALSVHNEAGGS
jgi:MurNAc alpha-1-phosphate uridylyltransferase